MRHEPSSHEISVHEIRWPDPAALFADITPPGGRWLAAGRDDIGRVIALASAYPDITVGMESCHLAPEFYDREVFLRDEPSNKPVFVAALERGDQLVAFASVEYTSRQRLLSGRLAVVAPSERHSGLGRLLSGQIPERIGRAIGAEILLSYVTLSHSISQHLLTEAGYTLVGVVPGYDRDLVDGEVVRVWEACYSKLLIAEDQVRRPDPAHLLPGTARLVQALGLQARRT